MHAHIHCTNSSSIYASDSMKQTKQSCDKGKKEDNSLERIVQNNMYPLLNPLEIVLYFAAWSALIAVGFYRLLNISSDLRPQLQSHLERVPAWFSGLSSSSSPSSSSSSSSSSFTATWWYRDPLDVEWSLISAFCLDSAPWILASAVLGRLLQTLNPPLLVLLAFRLFFSAFFLAFYVGLRGLLFLLALPVCAYAVLLATFSASCVWMWTLAVICGLHAGPVRQLRQQWLGDLAEVPSYIVNIATGWIALRCVSFCVHEVKDSESERNGRVARSLASRFLLFLTYCFYLPSVATGPMNSFENFEASISVDPPKPIPLKVLLQLVMFQSKFLLAILLKKFLNHFVYVSLLQHHVNFLRETDLFTLICMAGYASISFYLMYYVCYGVAYVYTEFDGIQSIPYPKCVLRTHLFSNYWRHFDVGLYQFIHKHIYSELLEGRVPNLANKLFASLSCFAFVFLWHGTHWFVFLWTLANLAGIVLEMLAKELSKWPRYREWQDGHFSPRSRRRWHALLSTPSYIFSVMALQYFFCGFEIGHIFVTRIILESDLVHISTLIALVYCGAQVSMECANWEERRKQNSLQKVL